MRPFLFALAMSMLVVQAGNEVRADLVTYDMTGIVEHVTPGFPVAAGDRLTWTIQYDRSLASASTIGYYEYHFNGPVLTNLVDQTTGYHFFLMPSPASMIDVNGTFRDAGLYGAMDFVDHPQTYKGISSWTSFGLLGTGVTPSSTLANLQLDRIPWLFGSQSPTSQLYYDYYVPASAFTPIDPSNPVIDLSAYITSLSGHVSVTRTPEPGALTLFVLGALGLAGNGLRRRLAIARSS